MKASSIKTLTKVHTWAGLGTGMALFIAFYAGAFTVFFHELSEWDDYQPHGEVYQDYDQAQRLIDQVLRIDPEAAGDFHLHLSEAHGHKHELFWFEQRDDGTFESKGYSLRDNGEVLRIDASNAKLAAFIYQLHYNAGLPDSWGLYVLGLCALIYGLAMITGLLIFLPNFLRDLLIIRAPKNLKRFWLDTHNVVGVISLPWHFMYAWSSVILAIGIFLLAPFQFLVFEDNLLEVISDELGQVPALQASGNPATLLPVDQVIAKAKELLPGLVPSELEYHHAGDVNGSVVVSGALNEGTTLVTNASVTMSATDGDLVAVNDPTRASAGFTMFFGLYALHFVSFGGYAAKWAYFFLGLAGAYLFYSGNLLWVESRRNRRRSEQRRDTVFLAKLNSGVCIGCMAGVSAMFVVSRATADLMNRPELLELTYYLVFIGAIGWCFARSVANGTRDLLYLSAAITLLIPFVDVLALGSSVWSAAIQEKGAFLCIDAMALLGAFFFWRLGVSVHRRARRGEPNSVWSLPESRHETILSSTAETPVD